MVNFDDAGKTPLIVGIHAGEATEKDELENNEFDLNQKTDDFDDETEFNIGVLFNKKVIGDFIEPQIKKFEEAYNKA